MHKLTESKLRKIIRESIANVLDDVAASPSNIGQKLGEITHNALRNDKNSFVPCVDEILKAYLTNNQQALMAIWNGYLTSIIDSLRRYHPEFYKSRYEAIKGTNRQQ